MNQELLASLRILGHVARADSRLRSEERLALEALAERDGGSATEVLHDHTDLDTLLRAVTSPELRRRTLEMMLAGDDLYEYYHPETREVPPKAAPLYGWSSALFIEMAIEETAALNAAPPQSSDP